MAAENATGQASRTGEVTLPAAARSPSRARTFVAGLLADWGMDDDGDVLLALSELVTNALLHARTGMTVRVVAEEEDVVRIEVSDGSTATPRGRRFTIESGTGRGLRLLDSLAEEWGVSTEECGKTVWARVRIGEREYAEFDIDAIDAL